MIVDADGVWWGTAAEIAQHLGHGVTAARVRDWARRSRDPKDPLYGRLNGKHFRGRGRGTTWYRLGEAQQVERLTRTRVRDSGGPQRGA